MSRILPKLKVDIHNDDMTTSLLYEYIDELKEKSELSVEKLLFLLDNISLDETQYLFDSANDIKELYYENKVYLRALIEISNYCNRTCLYCGINSSNKTAHRYRLKIDTILKCIQNAYSLGYRTFVLQGGEDAYFTDGVLSELIKEVKSLYGDTRITLSLGERSAESYKILKEAGADRYLLRHETATKEHYELLHHKSMSYENRIDSLFKLKELGYQAGAGFMVGSPFQSNENLVNDLLFLKNLDPQMIGIGPFIDSEDTIFKGFKNGGLDETLVMVALARLFVQNALIPATTALGTIVEGGRELALKSGANVLMPNLSPSETVDYYNIYRNKITSKDSALVFKEKLENRLKNSGFEVDYSVGDYIRKQVKK